MTPHELHEFVLEEFASAAEMAHRRARSRVRAWRHVEAHVAGVRARWRHPPEYDPLESFAQRESKMRSRARAEAFLARLHPLGQPRGSEHPRARQLEP